MDPRPAHPILLGVFGAIRGLGAFAAGVDYAAHNGVPAHQTPSLGVLILALLWSAAEKAMLAHSHSQRVAREYTAGLADGQAHEVSLAQRDRYIGLVQGRYPLAGESNVAVFNGTRSPLLQPREVYPGPDASKLVGEE